MEKNKNNENLSEQQLDEVAGGVKKGCKERGGVDRGCHLSLYQVTRKHKLKTLNLHHRTPSNKSQSTFLPYKLQIIDSQSFLNTFLSHTSRPARPQALRDFFWLN